MRAISRTLELVRQQGVWETVRRIATALRWKYVLYRDHLGFDRKYGTDTSGTESEYLKTIDSEYAAIAVWYEPTTWQDFRRMMRSIPIDRSRFTFVDAGSGKGRVLCFAALAGFKRIVGVEFAAHLAEAARDNVARFSRRKPTGATFDVQCLDVAAFELPATDLLLFMYNPFGAELMGVVVDKLRAFAERGTHVAYVAYRNPKCAALFEAAPFIETIESNAVYAVYRVRADS